MTSKATKAVKTNDSNKALNAQKAIIEALNTRISNVHLTANDEAGRVNQTRLLNVEISKFNNLAVIQNALDLNIDLSMLAKNIAQSDKKASNFIAIYALQKVRKMLKALADKIASSADSYSHTILFNLLHNQQNNKTLYVSLSRAHEFTELDTQQIIKKRYNCSAKTAETQASSTRMMMMFLNIASVTKNKTNDTFAIIDNDVTKRARSIFIKEVETKE